jgi:3-vinyl bacteriochlorophyllide hydratase
MNAPQRATQLYTVDQRRRRDASRWTLVQGVLAPVQFAAFAISLALVLHALATGTGYGAATESIIVKTAILYAIMITGAIWERDVYGRYLFAPAFWWEDAVSMVVLALHTGYVVALLVGMMSPHALLLLALAAYSTYVVNAAQDVLKFRLARSSAPVPA